MLWQNSTCFSAWHRCSSRAAFSFRVPFFLPLRPSRPMPFAVVESSRASLLAVVDFLRPNPLCIKEAISGYPSFILLPFLPISRLSPRHWEPARPHFHHVRSEHLWHPPSRLHRRTSIHRSRREILSENAAILQLSTFDAPAQGRSAELAAPSRANALTCHPGLAL